MKARLSAKISFHSHASKTNFDIKSFVLSLAFIVRFTATRTKSSHPRPCVTKLSPDDRVDWVFVSKPVLTTAVDDTAFNTLQNIPGKKKETTLREKLVMRKQEI